MGDGQDKYKGHEKENGLEELHDFDQEGSERPWQSDLDEVRQILQQVLQAVSRLTGVDLPGAGADFESVRSSLNRMDFKALKDRIHTELDAYASSTAAELTRQAQEEARAALEAVRNEVNGRIEQVSREFRQELQGRLKADHAELNMAEESKERVAELVRDQTEEFARWVWLTCQGTETPVPAQIEKLLEPYAEEASARWTERFRVRIQDFFDEEEHAVQQKVQGTVASLLEQIRAVDQAAQQIHERNADSVASLSRASAASEDAMKNLEAKTRHEAEDAPGEVASRIQSATENSLECQRKQLAQVSGASLRDEGEAVNDAVTNLQGRLRQAATLLAQDWPGGSRR